MSDTDPDQPSLEPEVGDLRRPGHELGMARQRAGITRESMAETLHLPFEQLEALEVELRVGVRAADREPVSRFTRELAPLILAGPPSVTGFAGGRPRAQEIMAFWPALVDREVVEDAVTVETVVSGEGGA